MQASVKYAEFLKSIVCKDLVAALSGNVGITSGACKLSQMLVNIKHVAPLSDKTFTATIIESQNSFRSFIPEGKTFGPG